MKNIKIGFLLIGVAVLTLITSSYAQTSLTPTVLPHRFSAISADYCSNGGARFYGYQYGSDYSYWSVTSPISTSGTDGYIAFSWTFEDEAGQLATGSWDSRTGVSTGGTYGASFGFSVSRTPVGEIRFSATGSYRGPGIGTSCEQSFNATSYTSYSGGGSSYFTVDTSKTYVFQNKSSGKVLQIAASSTADYEPATQATYAGVSNQNWTLFGASEGFTSGGYYKFTNNATNKPLYSDIQSGSSLVYQLSGSERGWRFISAGDGSYYIVYDIFQTGAVYTSYAMKPVKFQTTIEATERADLLNQRWEIFTIQ